MTVFTSAAHLTPINSWGWNIRVPVHSCVPHLSLLFYGSDLVFYYSDYSWSNRLDHTCIHLVLSKPAVGTKRRFRYWRKRSFCFVLFCFLFVFLSCETLAVPLGIWALQPATMSQRALSVNAGLHHQHHVLLKSLFQWLICIWNRFWLDMPVRCSQMSYSRLHLESAVRPGMLCQKQCQPHLTYVLTQGNQVCHFYIYYIQFPQKPGS